MIPWSCASSCSIRMTLVAALGAVCGLIFAAPFLASHSLHQPAAVLYFIFSPVCHQDAGRSFVLFGSSLAVCHRCTGIYLGMFLGAFFESCGMRCRIGRFCIIGALAPMAFDVLAAATGLWTGMAIVRFATGLFFGIVLSPLLARGLDEFAQQASWQRPTMHHSQIKGGIS